jgi:hypothetical protein
LSPVDQYRRGIVLELAGSPGKVLELICQGMMCFKLPLFLLRDSPAGVLCMCHAMTMLSCCVCRKPRGCCRPLRTSCGSSWPLCGPAAVRPPPPAATSHPVSPPTPSFRCNLPMRQPYMMPTTHTGLLHHPSSAGKGWPCKIDDNLPLLRYAVHFPSQVSSLFLHVQQRAVLLVCAQGRGSRGRTRWRTCRRTWASFRRRTTATAGASRCCTARCCCCRCSSARPSPF